MIEFFGIDNVHGNASRDVKRMLEGTSDNVISKEKTDLRPRSIPVLTLEAVGIVAAKLTAKGDKEALAYLIACQAETLERRIDHQLGIIRAEKERNERFAIRRDSILSRNFWTDCIDNYIKTHDVSENYKRFIYVHVSDYLNKALFGMTSKQIRRHYDIGVNSPRDYFPSDTLKLVDTIEKATAVRVKNNDVCPKQALKDVVMMLGLEPDNNRL